MLAQAQAYQANPGYLNSAYIIDFTPSTFGEVSTYKIMICPNNTLLANGTIQLEFPEEVTFPSVTRNCYAYGQPYEISQLNSAV